MTELQVGIQKGSVQDTRKDLGKWNFKPATQVDGDYLFRIFWMESKMFLSSCVFR